MDTVYSADCIEWCPFEPYQDIFVCGTYQVLEPAAASTSVTPAAVQNDKTIDELEDSDDEVDTSDAPKTQTQRTGRLLVFRADALTGSVCVSCVLG